MRRIVWTVALLAGALALGCGGGEEGGAGSAGPAAPPDFQQALPISCALVHRDIRLDAGPASDVAISSNSSHFGVVYRDGSHDGGIRFVLLDSDGNRVTSALLESDPTAAAPSVTWLRESDYLVVWRQRTAGPNGSTVLRARHVSIEGIPLAPPIDAADGLAADARPAVAQAHDEASIAWGEPGGWSTFGIFSHFSSGPLPGGGRFFGFGSPAIANSETTLGLAWAQAAGADTPGSPARLSILVAPPPYGFEDPSFMASVQVVARAPRLAGDQWNDGFFVAWEGPVEGSSEPTVVASHLALDGRMLRPFVRVSAVGGAAADPDLAFAEGRRRREDQVAFVYRQQRDATSGVFFTALDRQLKHPSDVLQVSDATERVTTPPRVARGALSYGIAYVNDDGEPKASIVTCEAPAAD
jgi:hypothetical protein